jgi:winged helix DNA-binding protein
MKTVKVPAASPEGLPFTAEQIHTFRLRRHHLLDRSSKDRSSKDLVTICRDVCGVQAQIMSAAQLQLWARNPAITPAMVNDALWQKRSLVKTTLMRQTLHLVPSDEFPLYVAAQRKTRARAVLRVMARMKITPDEAEGLSSLILEVLDAGPATHSAIAAAVRPKVSKRVRAWMDRIWSIVRLPIAEGQICYGYGEGNQATFIRTDHWLTGQKPVDESHAQKELLRKYLSAYGPATIKDFAHWAGISMVDARALRPLLDAETIEQHGMLVLRKDLKSLTAAPSSESSVHLLPYFDVYLLAHAVKKHFLEARFYKRVFRNQGWISPVVLIDGKIAGVWTYKLSRQTVEIEIELFSRIGRSARAQIELRAHALAGLFERAPSLSFKT